MAKNGDYGIEISFGAETATFDKSIKSMDKAIKALKKDISAINSNLKFNKLDGDLLTSKFKDYQQVIKATQAKLDNYRDELTKVYDANGKVTNEKEWIRLRGEISQNKAELVKLKDQAEKLKLIIDNLASYKTAEMFGTWGKKLGEASDRARTLAQNLAPISTIAGVALGGATKAAIEFESAMAGVMKTVDETPTTSYEQLAETFREMSQEIPSSAAEIAEVAEMAGQLGIQADSIENFTRTMIDLGNATNLTATDGAKAVAQFFNVMGHTSEEINDIVDNFGSAVTALGNNSATTEEEIVYMAKNLAAASHTIGLTDQEVLGLATTLASLGLSAERGGSAMSTVMRKIHTDVNVVTQAGEERLSAWGELMGMTAEQFREAWNENSVQVLHDIVLGLNQTEDAGKSLYEVLDDVDISNIRQIDTISRLALGYDRFDEYMEMANAEWEKNTALTIEANRRYATTESQLQILKNKLSDVGITLGQTILPIVNDLIDDAKPLLDRINQFVEHNGKLVVSMLAITTALSPVLFGISKVLKIGGTLATAVSKYIKLGIEATTVLGKVAAAIGLGASGIGLIAGIIALTAGLGSLAVAWYKAKDEVYQFQQQMDSLNTTMQESNRTADEEYASRMLLAEGNMIYAKRVDELMETLRNGNLTEAGQAEIKERIKAAVDQLNSALGENKYAFDEDTQSILVNGEATESTKDSYQKMIDEMRKSTWLETHKQSLQEAMTAQAEAIQAITEATETYKNSLQELERMASNVGISEKLFGDITSWALAGDSLDNILIRLQDLGAVDSIFNGSYADMADSVRILYEGIVEASTQADDKIAYGNELLNEAQGIIDQYYQAAGMPVDQFLLWESSLGRVIDVEHDSITALEAQKAKLEEIVAQEEARKTSADEADSALQQAAQAEIDLIDAAILKRQEQEQQERDDKEATKNFVFGLIDEQKQYAEEQNQAKADNMEDQDETMSDHSKDYFIAAMQEAVRQINAMKLDDKHLTVWVDLVGAGAEYIRGNTSINTAGFSKYRSAGFESGGYNSGNYNVTINSSVNVNGGSVTNLQAKSFAQQIVDTVNQELGKMVRA